MGLGPGVTVSIYNEGFYRQRAHLSMAIESDRFAHDG